MFTETKKLKNRVRTAILLVLPLFAACGGGGGDDEAAPSEPSDTGASVGGVLACVVVILVSGDDGCASAASSSSGGSGLGGPGDGGYDTGGSDPADSGPGDSGSTDLLPRLHRNVELEPNNDLMNANLPMYATRQIPDQPIGWIEVGTINDADDVRDVFAFTPVQAREYMLVLCPPEGTACTDTDGIDTLTAFFRILDQDGNVLLTSQADTENGNRHQMMLDAGVLYYATVDAGDTMATAVGYRFLAYETD